MRSTIVTATASAAVAAAVIALSACSSGGGGHTPNAAGTSSCEAALVADLKAALGAGNTAAPAPTPSACVGLDAATLQKLAAEASKAVINQELPSGFPSDMSALPTSPGQFPSDLPSGLPSVMPSDGSTDLASLPPMG